MSLVLKDLLCSLEGFTLDINVELPAHVTALFGPSGAGKTTLLDIVAGLRRPDRAMIQVDDRLLTDTRSRKSIPPHLRKIGYVPQDLALFPHLSVRDNLLYGFKTCPGPRTPFRLSDALEMLDIGHLLERRPGQLSGGEKQRIALGRALLSSPCLLLLDEPMASLDARLKERILPYLRRVRDTFKFPILYVSHDSEEVTALCDEVLILERGSIVQRGHPAAVLR